MLTMLFQLSILHWEHANDGELTGVGWSQKRRKQNHLIGSTLAEDQSWMRTSLSTFPVTEGHNERTSDNKPHPHSTSFLGIASTYMEEQRCSCNFYHTATAGTTYQERPYTAGSKQRACPLYNQFPTMNVGLGGFIELPSSILLTILAWIAWSRFMGFSVTQ
jgi:hypothetical protein